MALRMLLLAKKLKDLRAAGEALQAAKAEIEEKRKTWKEREERATAMLDEITAETPQEERDAFDAECAEIEAEDAAIRAEEEANAQAITEKLQEEFENAEFMVLAGGQPLYYYYVAVQ